MFDNIGWGEILVLGVVILIIVGPERLPDLIKDVRAAIFAARRAIANARAELDGTFGDEWDEFREPVSQAAEWTRMGPRKAIAKAIFDGDDAALDDLDPKKILRDSGVDPSRETPAQAAKRLRRQADALEKETRRQEPAPRPPQQPESPDKGNYETGGGFSWGDIT